MNNKKYVSRAMALALLATISTGLLAVSTGPSISTIASAKKHKKITFILYSPVLGNNHMEINAKWTVKDLKKHINKNYKIAVDKQVIYFGGVAQNDKAKLKDAVEKGITILMNTTTLKKV